MSNQNLLAVKRDFGYITGFSSTWVSTTTISMGPGQCRDSKNAMDICIGAQPEAGPITLSPTTINMAINGVNGLDQGSLAASSFYAIFAIGDSSYFNKSSFVATLQSNVSPAMPAGYDSYRLVGYFSTDASSHIRNYYQFGSGTERYVDYVNNLFVSTVTSTTPVNESFAAYVPSGIFTLANLYIGMTVTDAGDVFNINNSSQVTNLVATLTDFKQLPEVVLLQGTIPVMQFYWPGTAGSASVYLTGYNFSL